MPKSLAAGVLVRSQPQEEPVKDVANQKGDAKKSFVAEENIVMSLTEKRIPDRDEVVATQEGDAKKSFVGEEDATKSLIEKETKQETTIPTDWQPEDVGSKNADDEAALLTLSLTNDTKESVGNTLGLAQEACLESVRNHDEERDQALNEDIYSLFYTAGIMSQAFWFATFVFLVQLSVIWLIVFDLVDFKASNNKIRLPPGVPIMVNVAQGLGVLLIVFTVAVFGDLTTGMGRLIDGYDRRVLVNHPKAHCIKWFLSGFCQMLVGSSMTMVLFILLMQSTTVLSMCLNFAALHFVQEIDDMSFLLGQKGFLTPAIQQDCNRVSQLTVPKGRRRVRRWSREVFTVVLTIALFVPYFFLLKRQWDGEFVCRSLYVQFGDAYVPELAYFSGRYRLGRQDSFGGSKIDFRPVYFDATKQLRLSYCGKESAWVFSAANSTDHCNFIVKSSSTTTFDVVSLKDATWFSYNYETENVVPADWFYIGCNDCGRDSTQCNSDAGTCVDSICHCHPGRMGVNCQFPDPSCASLALDARTDPLPLEEGVTFPDSYQLSTYPTGEDGTTDVVEVNFHPAYISPHFENKYQNSTDIMFFTGRRWVIFAAREEDDTPLPGTEADPYVSSPESYEYAQPLIDNMLKNLGTVAEALGVSMDIDGGFFALYRPYFFSEPVDFGTPSDVLEPTGLDWFRAVQHHDVGIDGWQTDESQPLETNFLCSDCDAKSNPCYNNFPCDRLTETCVCDRFYAGSLCEHPIRCDQQPCLNNGTCNTWHGYCECISPYHGNLCQYKHVQATPVVP